MSALTHIHAKNESQKNFVVSDDKCGIISIRYFSVTKRIGHP